MPFPPTTRNETRHGGAQRSRSLPRRSPAHAGRSRVGGPVPLPPPILNLPLITSSYQHNRIELLPLKAISNTPAPASPATPGFSRASEDPAFTLAIHPLS